MTAPLDEVAAYIDAFADAAPNRLTACDGWTAHDVLAHAVAGGREIARLLDHVIAGEDLPATRSFDEREPPVRALPYGQLLAEIGDSPVAPRLREAMTSRPDASFPFTGWAMSWSDLTTHIRSERAIHRWDLLGSDEASMTMLANPDLTRHALRSLTQLDMIAERVTARHRRYGAAGGGPFTARLRTDGRLDVTISVDDDRASIELTDPDDGPALVADGAARLLMLWGRRPPGAHPMTSTLDPATQRCLDLWLYRT